jgi:cyanophycinase
VLHVVVSSAARQRGHDSRRVPGARRDCRRADHDGSRAEHQQAFGFLRRSAIDQHINTRNRWNDLQQVIGKFPNLLGIGISEATAIVVRGDQFEVMGKAQVAIHDSTHPQPTGEKPYVVLEAGDRYDMKARAVQRR